VFLPGVTCGGTLNPLTLSCTERQRPWPIGIENAGLDAVRNYFATPEGLEFYGAAPLGADAEARWLVADRNGALSLLDGSRQLIARVAAGDEVVALATPCGPETFVVVGARAGDRDALRLFHVARRRLMSVSSLIPLPGTLTALWAVPGSIAATVVAHDAAGGRYEAFRASITCSR